MSWINDIVYRYRMRDTQYNKSVCMTRKAVENMTQNFDGIFDGLLNFTEEISSLQLYPMIIKPYTQSETNYLSTTRGVFSSVTAYNISWYAYYQTLGEYFVQPKFNNFADYKGYTQIKLFLPFLGYVDVDVNECMGKYLQFRLLTDFYTGKGLYIIGVSDASISHSEPPYVNEGEDDGIRVISTFECDIGIDIPLGKSNVGDIKRNMLLGTIKTIASVGASIYTESLPSPITTSSSVTTYDVHGRSLSKGSRMKQVKSGTETTTKTSVTHKPVDKSKPISEAVDGSIDALNRLHISGHSDRVNDAGLLYQTSLNIQVVIYRPKFVTINENYGNLYGYPLGEVRRLSEISGYTEINSIHFEGVGFETITQKEVAMLEQIFSDGVFV